jgi:tyrosyl-tRNA synthetase
MKFIVISYTWGINAGIGSLRPMKIVKYLLKKGHEVVVICGDIIDDESVEDVDLKSFRINPHYNEIITFGYSGIFKRENSLVEKRIIRKKAKIFSNKTFDLNTVAYRNRRMNMLVSFIKKVLAILYDHL